MLSRARALFQKLQEWLEALRKICSTSRRVDRFGLEISHLHEEVSHLLEKARFNRDECERISALYDSVTARIALLEQRTAKQEQRLLGIDEPCTHPEKSPTKQIQEENGHQTPMTRVGRGRNTA